MRIPSFVVSCAVLLASPLVFGCTCASAQVTTAASNHRTMTTPAQAPMLTPGLDHPAEPFSYFAQPTDEIGVMDAQAATEITPEGYLRTGSAELLFFTGPGQDRLLVPVRARLRTLTDGHLPIDHYHVLRNGIDYRFTVFAATLDGRTAPDGSGVLVNFLRVRLVNTTAQPTRAIFAAATRYDAEPNTASDQHGEFRFNRPVAGRFPGDYRQPGESFDPNWVYSFAASPGSPEQTTTGRFLRSGELIYSFPSRVGNATVYRSLTLATRYNYPPDLTPRTLPANPTTAVGLTRWMPVIPPHGSLTLDLKMPVQPTRDPATIAAIEAASLDRSLARTTAFWQQILAQGMQLTLPEPKVTDTFAMSLVYDLIARDHIGPNFIQTVNKLHYHSFYLRDGADIAHMYDLTGYPAIARQTLDFFSLSQKPDGNFLSQPQQYDGWGEALWGYGQHYQITHDAAFAAWALPQIDRAVDWLIAARAQDPLHLIPASNVRDNEYIPGHLTGYSFLALSGLRVSIAMARSAGRDDLARKWQPVYDSYRSTFLAVLDKQTAANHNIIPPALDGDPSGQFWGNLLAVVPEPTLALFDPRVTATLRAAQARYAEGIMTYGDGRFLHHYLTIKNTLTEVVRDDPADQLQATRELYALLVHTSSTQAGFEFAIRPWGERNFQDNLAPHGWFAAEYRTLLRQMLVREDGADLHLLSVVSPEWIGPGKTIAVRQAPTQFGPIAFTFTQPDATHARLQLDSHFTIAQNRTTAPRQLILHIPWFLRLDAAQADGHPLHLSPATTESGATLTLPATTHTVTLTWSPLASAPGANLSYQQAVEQYKAEYTRRYNAWLHGQQGQPTATAATP